MSGLTIFILGTVGSFTLTIINPFLVLPVFIFAHFVEPIQYFPELRNYNPGLIVGLVVLLALIIHFMVKGVNVSSQSKQTTLVILLIFWTIFSYIFNSHNLLTDTKYQIQTMIPFFLFAYVVQSRSQVILVFWTLLFFGVISSLYGIYCAMNNIGISDRGMLRIGGFFENPNDFGLTMALLIPFAISFLFSSYGKIVKIIIMGSICLFLLSVMYSYSRNAFFALLLILAIFPFVFFNKVYMKFLTFGVTIFCLLFAFYFMPSGPKYRIYYRSIGVFEAESAQELDSGRTETNKAGIRIMFQNPIFGVGLGGFKDAYIDVALRSDDIDLVGSARSPQAAGAHNVFVQIGAQLGIVGLILYLLLVYFSYIEARRTARLFTAGGDKFLALLSSSIQVFIVVAIFVGMFTQMFGAKIFWVVIPLVIVLKRLALQQQEELARVANKEKVVLVSSQPLVGHPA
ncbi:O-antigen ligase family protein [Desulfonatronum parangueonense]